MTTRSKTDPTSALDAIVPANTTFRHDENGKAICGATNRAGRPCKSSPMTNGRCRLHGGLSPKGPSSPQFKHGRYSKYMPPAMASMIEDMAADPNRLDQTQQLGILDMLLVETLKDFNAGGGGRVWDELKKLKQDYDRAKARKDTDTMVQVVNEVFAMIESSYGRYLASKESREIIADRRKLTESERKRMMEEKQMIPVDQVVIALSKIGDSIRIHVPDDRAKQYIFNDVLSIIGSFQQAEREYYAGTGATEDD
jgi:hypothetical protein